MIERRTFLKLGAALGLTKYAEPIAAIRQPRDGWIEDRGDYVVIRVPERKILRRVSLDKPTIVFLGADAMLTDVVCRSFMNVDAGPGSSMHRAIVDARGVDTESRRGGALLMRGATFSLVGAEVFAGPSCSEAIHIDNASGGRSDHVLLYGVDAHIFDAPQQRMAP